MEKTVNEVLKENLEYILKKEPYGWVIECNMAGKYSTDGGKTYKWTPWTGWLPTFRHKLYKTKEIALEAVKSMSQIGSGKTSYRILPVYSGEPEVLDNILDLPLK